MGVHLKVILAQIVQFELLAVTFRKYFLLFDHVGFDSFTGLFRNDVPPSFVLDAVHHALYEYIVQTIALPTIRCGWSLA